MGDDVVEVGLVPGGVRLDRGGRVVLRQGGDDVADALDGVRVIGGEVVGDTGDPGVHGTATEFLGGDVLAGGGLHQRRTGEEDGALAVDDDGLVGDRRDVGAAGGAGTHDGGELRDSAGGHPRLVVEDPAEVVAVREYLVLLQQHSATGIHQVDAGQPVGFGDLLGAQVLLHRLRVVGTAGDGRVIGGYETEAPLDESDTGDDAGSGDPTVVHVLGGQRRHLEEGAAGVEQGVHPVPRQHLAAGEMALPGLVPSPATGAFNAVAEFGGEIGEPGGRCRIGGCRHSRHGGVLPGHHFHVGKRMFCRYSECI